MEKILRDRSGSVCELCAGKDELEVYPVPPVADGVERQILACKLCRDQIDGQKPMDAKHWRCLNTSMWSAVPAVQVMAWRLLDGLRHEGWPQDLSDMMYLDEETLAWAKAVPAENDAIAEEKIIHRDSNVTQLQDGDSVTLVKDLEVKGAGFTAKRGTAVRSIALVENNAGQIEGKVNSQQIVILTQFVKKST